MHTDIHVVEFAAAVKSGSTRIYVGRRDLLLSDQVIGSLPVVVANYWEKMVNGCPPGDAGSASGTWTDGPKLSQVVVCVLPEHCSRHNSPARPHAITHLLKGHIAPKGDTSIICVLENASHAEAAAVAIGRAIPSYNRKSDSTEHSRNVRIGFLADDEKTVDTESIEIHLEAARFAARLVDTPASELHTTAFADIARDVAAKTDSEIQVLEGESLAHAGMGGLWGVGKAAIHPPIMVILEHRPKKPTGKTYGWVGKGIVYDTGGLSIKSKTGMPGMKMDMGGAAAVLAAFRAAVQLQSEHRIIAILCLAENSVGPESTRPDDVLTMYSGLTVEVNNTDAEGRLVLADGVAYMNAHYTPDVIIDLATLTGAQLVATGQRHAGIVSNDEQLEARAVRVGRSSGDLVHPLPYCPEFFRKEFKSAVADMKNSVKDRGNAQSSCAAQFIANHLGDYTGEWLHVDLAGPAWQNERGTGFGTNLLLGLLDGS